jgi:outer membrane protein insertion porin family
MFNKQLGLLTIFVSCISCIMMTTRGSGSVTILPHDPFLNVIKKLSAKLPQELVVDQVTFESDIYLDREEFAYLFAIVPFQRITIENVARSCLYLQKKNAFSSIIIHITQCNDRFSFHLELIGAWVFNKIKFEGMVLGKENYRQYYAIEVGENFDIEKHEQSIERIKKAFSQEGYCNAKVTDYLLYNKENKSITVHVVFEPEQCFVIHKVTLEAKVYTQEMQEEAQSLIDHLKKIVIPRLDQQYFNQEFVTKQTIFIKEYLAKRGFYSVKIKLNKEVDNQFHTISLKFLLEFDQKRLFIFTGNHFFSDQDLFAQMALFGSAATIIPASIIKEELEHMYKKKGFWSAKIDVQQQDEKYLITIYEGERVTITSVVFKGIQHANHAVLTKQFFSSVINSYYDETILTTSVRDCIAWYESEGFWDIQLIKKDFSASVDMVYQLVLTFDEGVPRYVGNSIVVGFDAISPLLPYAHPSINRSFDKKILYEQKTWLTTFFHNQGYAYVQIKSELKERGCFVDVLWYVDTKNTKISFGKTVLVGKTSIPFSYLKKELCYRDGQVWSTQKIDASLKNLRDLNMFETMFMYPQSISENDQEKAVILKLVEDDPLEIKVRAGFQQVSKNLTFRNGTTYKLGGSILYKNPLHVADFLSADLDVTKYYRNLTLEYHRPWFLGKRVGVSLKGYTIKYIQPVTIGSKHPLYQAIQQGILFYFGRRYEWMTWGTNIGIEFMETNKLSAQLAHAINFEPTLIDVKIPNVFFEPSLVLDFLDDKMYPRHGTFTVVSGKAMFPWKRDGTLFFKVLFEHSIFYPILTNSVLAFRGRAGHIFQDKFANIMPPERFYLGGENSLRSYEWDSVPPLGSYIDEDGNAQYVQRGGKTMFNINTELRFPLYKQLTGVIFQDLGTLIEKSWTEIKGGKLFAATGFGFRYNTPIGALRFDMGFKWKKRYPKDSIFVCFFTLGQAF